MPGKVGNPNWGNGRSGNPNGRPGNPAIKELEDAIKKVQKRHSKTLMEHFVERAYKSDNVLTAITKKRVPDLSSVDMGFNPEKPLSLSNVLETAIKRSYGKGK
jgi:hypothetical protein